MTQELVKQKSELETFLKENEMYFENISVGTNEIRAKLKSEVVADQDKYLEIRLVMQKFRAKATTFPPGFVIPIANATAEDSKSQIVFLSESDIEDGGPQPRLEIRPDDPETVLLFESIKPKDGSRSNILGKNQKDPIDVYPSPLGNGKFRICEGHRRRMVIFPMLRLNGIWAFKWSITEQEAYELALILNEKKPLTTADKAHFYLQMMDKFPELYPTLESVAKRVGETKQQISLIILAYKEIKLQKEKLPPEMSTKVDALPEHTIREARKAPEQTRTAVIKMVIDHDLGPTETRKLVSEVKKEPNPTESTVEEKAQQLIEEARTDTKKEERTIDKLMAAALVKPPEELVREAISRAGGEKITQEKLNAFLGVTVGVMFEELKRQGKIDFVFEETAKW